MTTLPVTHLEISAFFFCNPGLMDFEFLAPEEGPLPRVGHRHDIAHETVTGNQGV